MASRVPLLRGPGRLPIAGPTAPLLSKRRDVGIAEPRIGCDYRTGPTGSGFGLSRVSSVSSDVKDGQGRPFGSTPTQPQGTRPGIRPSSCEPPQPPLSVPVGRAVTAAGWHGAARPGSPIWRLFGIEQIPELDGPPVGQKRDGATATGRHPARGPSKDDVKVGLHADRRR